MVKKHRSKRFKDEALEEDLDFQGRETYYHQILSSVIAHPNCKQVIPLGIEGISKEDGFQKNRGSRHDAKSISL